MTATCPNAETLRAFLAGRLAGDELERVAGHLDQCPSCDAVLGTLDEQADSFLEHLRHLSSARPTESTVPPVLMRHARLAIETDGDGHRELVIDAGRRIARQLEEGSCRLGRFELIEPVGVGSFGHVFRARDTELDRVVAVKVQRATSLDGEDDTKRFHREARSAAQLEHPNIVSLYETGETDDGASYLVTEFIEGQTLEDRMRERRLEERESAVLIADIARALAYAHSRGVIHRDIKPSNIIIDLAGRPHIMDFGLAKREGGEITVTVDGEVMGTPAYMSPEQARGDSHHVDVRSDLFSLGVILYELMTGERPFQGNRRMMMLQLLEDEPRTPRQLNETAPRDLETICLKAMAKTPGHRYISADALADDLDRFVQGEPILARRANVARRLRHWCRRNPLAATLFAAVTVGATVGMLSLSLLSHELVEDTALGSARMQAEMLEEVNSFYSDIVFRLQDVEVTHRYIDREGAVPLPATFTIEAGRRISASKSGMQVRLYSDFPFPWREEEGGPRDAFEREALAALRADPRRPQYEFTELDGRPVLRHATARTMEASCVACHNGRPDSPKRDWQVGDVRGVLEIIRPLHRDVARVRSGLRGSFILMGSVAGVLLAVGVVALFRSDPRSISR